MKNHRPFRAVRMALFALLALVVLALMGLVVMSLWNWLLPALFGWKLIGYWQALGLIVLCHLLFGGFGGHRGRRGYFGRRARERWEQMTPEEREKFRQGMQSCWRGAPPSESNPA